MSPLSRAISFFKTQVAFATAISAYRERPTSKQNVRNWLRSGQVPAHWCRPIEQAVAAEHEARTQRGEKPMALVTRAELRPDIFGGGEGGAHAGSQ